MIGTVTSSLENGTGTISFFHPHSNSLPGEILNKLSKEIARMGKAPEVKVIVLKSDGEKTFCGGASFEELVSIKNKEQGKKFFSGFSSVINSIRTSSKFVIARVQGRAVGGGVGLAAAADYVFASESASVKLSELAIGIGPFVIGPAVERKIGMAAFSHLSINATSWQSADWAKSNGLYNEVFKTLEELDLGVKTLSEILAKSNPEAMEQLKKIFWAGTEHWDGLLQERAAISGELILSDFSRKAIEKFKSK